MRLGMKERMASLGMSPSAAMRQNHIGVANNGTPSGTMSLTASKKLQEEYT